MDRYYDRNFTIAYRVGVLRDRMNAYKFCDGAAGWGLIFARVLIGYLNDNRAEFASRNLIVANPTYSRKPKPRNNASFIVGTAAKINADAWPFDDQDTPAIIKIRNTSPMHEAKWRQRQTIAEDELRQALRISDVARTRGKRVIVFDDLFTTGHTLNEVARCLVETGRALQVTGISLARQPRGSGG